MQTLLAQKLNRHLAPGYQDVLRAKNLTKTAVAQHFYQAIVADNITILRHYCDPLCTKNKANF
jgi:hypothetical protein